MILEFYKYQGTGNDFILIDDRKKIFDINDENLISALCERKMGIGADGLILLRDHNEFDFEMIYFNSDGMQSSMCGNGGRCIVDFARLLEIITNETTFLAIDGIHKARIDNEEIFLQMRDVNSIEGIDDGIFLDTGSPHFVKMVDNFDSLNVTNEGKKIRNSSSFKTKGVNVNFVLDSNDIQVRTYERGVEAETLSCGTGVVATALALHHANCIDESIVHINTKGGELSVSFEVFNETYRNIWLSGAVSLVYIGDFEC